MACHPNTKISVMTMLVLLVLISGRAINAQQAFTSTENVLAAIMSTDAAKRTEVIAYLNETRNPAFSNGQMADVAVTTTDLEVSNVILGYMSRCDAHRGAQYLIPLLKKANPVTMMGVVHALGKNNTPEIIQPLKTIVFNVKNPMQARLLAISAIGSLQNADAVNALNEIAGEDDLPIRIQATHVLGATNCLSALPILVRSLSDKNVFVRVASIEALGMMQEAEAIQSLLPFINDPDRRIRQAVILALGDIGDSSARNAIIGHLKVESEAVQVAAIVALGKMPDAIVVDLLLPFTKSDNIAVKTTAIEILGLIGDKRATQSISRNMTDADQLVRRTAVKALYNLCDTSASAVLLTALNDHSPRVRQAAALALINNKDTTTVDFLIAYLKQEQDEMALSMILNRLCEFHDERIRKYMKTLVSSPNSYARQAAIEALSTYGEAEHATIKNAYLTDQSKHIQIIAARYLVTIYNDQEPIVFLRKVAVSNDLDDRLFALGILAQVNDQVALQALIAEYATANASTAKSLMQYIGQFPRTQPVTQFLLKSLNDIPELRDQALQCLQAHHRTTPADLVIPLLAGGSPQVAQNALRALYGTDNDRVIQLAIKLSHDDSIEITCSAIRLLATVPQSLTIADTLIELLNHRSSNVREQAVLALLHYKLPASRIALMNRVEIESSTRVSNALRKALAELQ